MNKILFCNLYTLCILLAYCKNTVKKKIPIKYQSKKLHIRSPEGDKNRPEENFKGADPEEPRLTGMIFVNEG